MQLVLVLAPVEEISKPCIMCGSTPFRLLQKAALAPVRGVTTKQVVSTTEAKRATHQGQEQLEIRNPHSMRLKGLIHILVKLCVLRQELHKGLARTHRARER